jgi:dihydrodipicolinate synthase/N-acetylneuraminate lyase
MVTAAADKLPVLAYHYPAVSLPGLSLVLLHELPVVGLKDSSGDAERLLDEIADYGGAPQREMAARIDGADRGRGVEAGA